jgi:hypothetical protein
MLFYWSREMLKRVGIIEGANAMNSKHIFALSILVTSIMWASTGLAQEADCRAIFHTSAQMTGESPGSLSTAMNTPCILSRHIGGTARGRAPGKAGGIAIVQQPKNGSIRLVNRSSLIFTPNPGFTGSDTMLVRMEYAGGKGGLVRFAIIVN